MNARAECGNCQRWMRFETPGLPQSIRPEDDEGDCRAYYGGQQTKRGRPACTEWIARAPLW